MKTAIFLALSLLCVSCAAPPRAITISEHEIRLALDVLNYLTRNARTYK